MLSFHVSCATHYFFYIFIFKTVKLVSAVEGLLSTGPTLSCINPDQPMLMNGYTSFSFFQKLAGENFGINNVWVYSGLQKGGELCATKHAFYLGKPSRKKICLRLDFYRWEGGGHV